MASTMSFLIVEWPFVVATLFAAFYFALTLVASGEVMLLALISILIYSVNPVFGGIFLSGVVIFVAGLFAVRALVSRKSNSDRLRLTELESEIERLKQIIQRQS